MSRSGNEEFLPGNRLSEKPQKHLNLAHLCGQRGICNWYLCV